MPSVSSGSASSRSAAGNGTPPRARFGEARDAGAGGVAAAAEYGLAAVAFNQGKTDDFKKLAARASGGAR